MVIPALKQTKAISFQERPEREFSLSIPTLIVAAMGLFVLLTTSARNAPAEEGEVELLLKKGSEDEWDEDSSCFRERNVTHSQSDGKMLGCSDLAPKRYPERLSKKVEIFHPWSSSVKKGRPVPLKQCHP